MGSSRNWVRVTKQPQPVGEISRPALQPAVDEPCNVIDRHLTNDETAAGLIHAVAKLLALCPLRIPKTAPIVLELLGSSVNSIEQDDHTRLRHLQGAATWLTFSPLPKPEACAILE